MEASKRRGGNLAQYLDRQYSLAIYPGQVVVLSPIIEEMGNLRDELTAATVELSFQQDKIQAMKSRLNQLLTERDSYFNSGKVVEHVGVRHQRRKLAHFRDSTETALWFAESFGLIPEALTVRMMSSNDQLTISLAQSNKESGDSPGVSTAVREADEFTALQTLYLLDRFGVSDEFYHELTQVLH